MSHEAGDTNARRGYNGEPIVGSFSVWVHFDRHASTITTACLWKMSPSEERVSRGGERGGGVTLHCSSSS
jgi:hypothetical protein